MSPLELNTSPISHQEKKVNRAGVALIILGIVLLIIGWTQVPRIDSTSIGLYFPFVLVLEISGAAIFLLTGIWLNLPKRIRFMGRVTNKLGTLVAIFALLAILFFVFVY